MSVVNVSIQVIPVVPEERIIVKKAQDICVKHGATRVVSIVKIDCKPEGVTINEKTYKYRK